MRGEQIGSTRMPSIATLGFHLACAALPEYASLEFQEKCKSADPAAQGHSSEFCHELLLQNPGLLNALLTKATSSQQGFEDVSTEVCRCSPKAYII